MPLTPKGKKIMKAMRKQYGKKEGESVFYASKNKGTIEGVDEAMNDKGITRSQAMKDHAHGSFGPKRGVKKKKGAKPKKINLATIVSRTKSPEGKRARAKETMKRNLMAHTVYHDMGYLMAESLGLVSEENRDRDWARDAGAPREAPKKKPKQPPYDSTKALKRELAAKAKRQGKTADDVIIKEPAAPLTPEQKAAREKFQAKQKKSVATAKLKYRARTTGEPQKVIKRKKR